MSAQARLAIETPCTTRNLAHFVSFVLLLLLQLCTMQWFSTKSARSVAPQCAFAVFCLMLSEIACLCCKVTMLSGFVGLLVCSIATLHCDASAIARIAQQQQLNEHDM